MRVTRPGATAAPSRPGVPASLAGQSGVGLIEVLVAILLLSIALLGFAKLQLETMQDQRLSYSHTMAQVLATNLSERMHANTKGISGYAVTDIADRASSGGCAIGCGPAALAAQDLDDWQEAIDESALTRGNADIAISGRQVTITIEWQDALSDALVQQPFTFEVRSG